MRFSRVTPICSLLGRATTLLKRWRKRFGSRFPRSGGPSLDSTLPFWPGSARPGISSSFEGFGARTDPGSTSPGTYQGVDQRFRLRLYKVEFSGKDWREPLGLSTRGYLGRTDESYFPCFSCRFHLGPMPIVLQDLA